MPERIEIPDSFPRVGDVSGKRVVITGAGRGLGELIAHAFSREGARVALAARTERDLKSVAAALLGPRLSSLATFGTPISMRAWLMGPCRNGAAWTYGSAMQESHPSSRGHLTPP